jgi:hypothetical protein
MFATGLVLGFSLLGESIKNTPERRVAFLKSLHVLGELRRLSPQAEQYYRILSSFHVEIKAYKERLNRLKCTSEKALVDRVFLPNIISDLDESEITTQLPTPNITALHGLSTDWANELSFSALDDTSPIDPTLLGENDVIMRMLWESDSYAMEYSGSMTA